MDLTNFFSGLNEIASAQHATVSAMDTAKHQFGRFLEKVDEFKEENQTSFTSPEEMSDFFAQKLHSRELDDTQRSTIALMTGVNHGQTEVEFPKVIEKLASLYQDMLDKKALVKGEGAFKTQYTEKLLNPLITDRGSKLGTALSYLSGLFSNMNEAFQVPRNNNA